MHLSERCAWCGVCARACPAKALTLLGTWMTPGDVLQVIKRDASFYANSGGGMTLSGGEPLAQEEFSYEILRQCHRSGIHTALETSGYASWESLRAVLPYTDLVLLDLKVIDPRQHRQLTGADNDVILANAARLAKSSVKLVVRVPIIPGQNDDQANLRATAAFLARLRRIGQLELLPYNQLAQAKYVNLGLNYALAGLVTQNHERMQEIERGLASSGWPVTTVWGLFTL